jgi:hypothetical protein
MIHHSFVQVNDLVHELAKPYVSLEEHTDTLEKLASLEATVALANQEIDKHSGHHDTHAGALLEVRIYHLNRILVCSYMYM